ncbi:MAG TPA: hypothetical protein VGG65_00050, partial [Thermoanaerobaculia bacterium]
GSVYRAMVLRQLAIEGKLPAYEALDASGTWLGSSVAYLAGSAFLEWLSERAGPGSLPRLWERMASSGGFAGAFRETFGDAPRALYDRFRAELGALAAEEDKRLRHDGLVEGEPWLDPKGGALAAQVSPDGGSLLARRDPTPKQSALVVWPVASAGTTRWTLPRANGFSASDPRWLPEGRAVLFSRRAPDREGILRWDLHRWDLASGSVTRVTRLADVFDADPDSSGGWAIAVRGRYGASSLVRVDLATGGVQELSVELPVQDAWPVWSHPRVSPDGRRIAALLHAGNRWRLVTLPATGGRAREILPAAAPVSAPAWSADGSRVFTASGGASGIWNLLAVTADGDSPPAALTRVTGGAFGPAPTPDGKALYFLDFTAAGVAVRRLDLDAPRPPSAEAPAPDAYPLRPRAREERAFVAAAKEPPATPYDAWPSLAVRPLLDFSFSPSGNTVQLGADAGDVLGRLHAMAMGSAGDAVGPRGGTLAAGYRGLPVALTAQVFSAIEKPGNQSLAPRPAFDEERFGGFVGASWSRQFLWGGVEAHAGAGGSRVEAFATASTFTRALGSTGARLVYRRTRGRSGFGVDVDAAGTLGSSDGSGWTQWTAGGRAVGILPFANLSASARVGDTRGSPTLFDLFAIGGAPSAILPPELDANRIASPALPADLQVGERFEAFRAELAGTSVPVALYAEWLRAWSGGPARPDPVRVVGAEVRLERLIPPEFGRTIAFHVGAGWIVSDAPSVRAARGYAQLIYRP